MTNATSGLKPRDSTCMPPFAPTEDFAQLAAFAGTGFAPTAKILEDDLASPSSDRIRAVRDTKHPTR